MKKSYTCILFIACLMVGFSPAEAQQPALKWEPRQDLNILLPPSVRVYEASGKLMGGAPVRAVYATVDLRDENLKLRSVGSNTRRQTTKEAYEEHNGILAINAGYFAATSSVSLLVSDGEVIAPGTRMPTRGAFGLVNGKPEITWTYGEKESGKVYKYPTPQKVIGATTAIPKGGEFWLANQATGGGPVLLKNGQINVTSAEEGFGGSHLVRHPRTAIGYRDAHTLVMMVVDGRQNSSAGVTLPELAQLMQQVGCQEALNLDGGGSSAMIAADEVVSIPTDIPNGDRNSLRKNASALVLSEAIKSTNREVIYLDTDSRHYTETGLWSKTNHASYYGTTASRQASISQELFKASYNFSSIPKGRYQLAAWWTVNENTNAERVPYVLHHSGKTDTLFVDQKSLSTSGRWNVLGDFILGPGDYLELINKGKGSKVVADAVRLVALEQFPPQPKRGDLRIAVISDLNSGLGADTYEWQVDSLLQRLPRIWQPDLVVCGGDMVAGQGVSNEETLIKMWAGFNRSIAQPLRKAKVPFAFTIGNHDGARSYPNERKATSAYWAKQENDPGLKFVDRSHFPYYYSFVKDGVFFVSWDASSSEITEENLAWMAEQFEKPEAKKAKLRFVLGHMPLYSVAQERDSKGNVLNNPERLRQLLQQYQVHTYISGHHHAYYPGKRGRLELLNAGAAGSGARGWLTLDEPPMNTVTIIDIFLEQDSIAYTTYDIKHRDARDMALFDEQKLPQAIFGVNGFLIKRDVRTGEGAEGTFSGLHVNQANTTKGTGSLKAQIKNNKLIIQGTFKDLAGKTSKEGTAIGLYKGRNTEPGELLFALKPKPKSGMKGNFKGEFDMADETAELLAVGALHVQVSTEKHPEGELRTQLYPASNQAPAAPVFTSHNTRNIYAVRDIEALFEVAWSAAKDPDSDFIGYTYQLSTDQAFNNIIWHKPTGRVRSLKLREQDWYGALGTAAVNQPVTLYHRVIASDGKHLTYGEGTPLQLMKSDQPLEDFVEVPAPEYVFDSKIHDTGAGSGAQWDKYGKLWLADYYGKLIVKQTDGQDAPFSPLQQVSVKGKTYNLNTINGIGVDRDGNILVGRNRLLIKIDAATGQGIAVWEVPEGNRAVTSPRANDKGEIYLTSLFAEDKNYVLRQSTSDPSTFDLVRTIELPERILAREFDMTPDGLTLYFPNPGSPYIQKYSSKDGITYTREEDITSIAAGSNAIAVGPDNTIFTAVRSSGVVPSSFHFRDDAKKRMWTLPLPELDGAEARGIGVSANGDTLIFCSWDKGGGFYRYVLRNDSDKEKAYLQKAPATRGAEKGNDTVRKQE